MDLRNRIIFFIASPGIKSPLICSIKVSSSEGRRNEITLLGNWISISEILLKVLAGPTWRAFLVFLGCGFDCLGVLFVVHIVHAISWLGCS